VICNAQQVLDFATVNGARAIGMQDELGSIEPGKYADLIILDGKAPNLRPLLPENMVANIVYSGDGLNTKTVFCQGDMVMQDGRILTLDKDAILDRSEDIWKTLCLR
jgi:5-methylthioadenosine/S-adenosylhomocysteine deaminase